VVVKNAAHDRIEFGGDGRERKRAVRMIVRTALLLRILLILGLVSAVAGVIEVEGVDEIAEDRHRVIIHLGLRLGL
jgi:hypothetical protein